MVSHFATPSFVKKLKITAVVSHKVLYYQRKVVYLWAKIFDMDYIDFPRKLIYRERSGLEDFVEEHEENTLFIDNMLDSYYFSSADGKERALRCFNTAYYLCTIILQCKTHPEWNFAKYCDIAFCGDKGNKVYQSFTLSLVYIFLTNTFYEVSCKKLLKKLHDYLYNITHFLQAGDPFLKSYYYSDVCDDLLKDAPDNFLIGEEFSPRKIDRDIFREVDGPGYVWNSLTNDYNGNEIRKIVDSLGKDEDEKHILIELIKRDAQRFYGGNSYYHETVKPMLDEMDGMIYHINNNAADQAMMEAKIEGLQNQGDVRSLQARIAELEAQLNVQEQDSSNKENQKLTEDVITRLKNDLEAFKTQNGKNRMTASQAAILLLTVCHNLGKLPNDKKKLTPVLEQGWGFTETTASRALGSKPSQDVADETASIFESVSPKLARLIKEFPQTFETIRLSKLKANNDKKVKKQ